MRNERRQFAHGDARPLARPRRDRVHRGGGPPEHRLARLPQRGVTVGDRDVLSQVSRAAPHHRADARRFAVRDRADHRGAGAVGEDNAGGSVGRVDPRRHLLRPDHQHVPGGARPDRVGGVRQRVAEAGARGVEVVRAGCDDAEPVRCHRGNVRYRRLGAAGGDDDQVDVGGGEAAAGQRLASGHDRHVGHALIRPGEPAADDADPAADPLVARVDRDREVIVGDRVARLVTAERQDARTRGGHERAEGLGGCHAPSLGWTRTSG